MPAHLWLLHTAMDMSDGRYRVLDPRDGPLDRFAALHTGVRKIRARTVPYVQPEPSGKYRFVSPFRQESDTL